MVDFWGSPHHDGSATYVADLHPDLGDRVDVYLRIPRTSDVTDVLLRTYVERFGPQDDASLILWGPGLEEDALLALAQDTIVAAGIDDAQLGDVLLLPGAGSAAIDAALAERSDALLSDWPAVGRLGAVPRYEALPLAA